ncbi:MAG TPA: hypothetical protein VFS67_20350 [Polyangiaceae bacterium]|nr:hypothetical protein [Polyangiaceae bacterium]
MREPDTERTYLENQATDVRVRLEQRLGELFMRRRQLSAVARRVAHPPTRALVAAAIGLTAIALVAQRVQRRRRQRHRLLELLALLRSQPLSEKGFVRQTLEKTARSLLRDAARQLGRRGLEQMLLRSPVAVSGPARWPQNYRR